MLQEEEFRFLLDCKLLACLFSLEESVSPRFVIDVDHVQDRFDVLALTISETARFDGFEDIFLWGEADGIPVDAAFAQALGLETEILNKPLE